VKLKNNLTIETKLKWKCKLKMETETGKLFQKGITVVVSVTCTKQFTAAVNVGLTSVLIDNVSVNRGDSLLSNHQAAAFAFSKRN